MLFLNKDVFIIFDIFLIKYNNYYILIKFKLLENTTFDITRKTFIKAEKFL